MDQCCYVDRLAGKKEHSNVIVYNVKKKLIAIAKTYRDFSYSFLYLINLRFRDAFNIQKFPSCGHLKSLKNVTDKCSKRIGTSKSVFKWSCVKDEISF